MGVLAQMKARSDLIEVLRHVVGTENAIRRDADVATSRREQSTHVPKVFSQIVGLEVLDKVTAIGEIDRALGKAVGRIAGNDQLEILRIRAARLEPGRSVDGPGVANSARDAPRQLAIARTELDETDGRCEERLEQSQLQAELRGPSPPRLLGTTGKPGKRPVELVVDLRVEMAPLPRRSRAESIGQRGFQAILALELGQIRSHVHTRNIERVRP